MLRISVGLVLSLWCGFAFTGAGPAPGIAFYYGANPPWDELRAFDIVVVEPLHGIDPKRVPLKPEQLYAYVAAGEIEGQRPYFKDAPEGLLTGTNDPWSSHVVDQTHPDWPTFFLDRIVAPLWGLGYRGFFLDTLDSFNLIAKDDEARARQTAGLAKAIQALRARFPDAKLVFNRGFEILPLVHKDVQAVAAESLFRGWNQKDKAYVEVPANDHAWLLGQLTRVRDEYGLPVIAIEYAPPGNRDLARATAVRVAELGFVPWVTNAELNQVGIGNIEVVPRRVVILYDSAERDAPLYAQRIRVQAKKPLNDLGYEVDFVDVAQPLPDYPLVGRYAGIVSWFSSDQAVLKPGVREWLQRQRDHGMRMAVLGNFPFPLTDSLASAFGLSAGYPRAPRAVRVEVQDPLLAPAGAITPDARVFTPLRATSASATLLRLRSDTGETMDAAALMPWGGYVLAPYETAPHFGNTAGGERWLIEPKEFMRRALALPAMMEKGRAGGDTRGELERNASQRSPTNYAS